jgi:Flp pilus assembly protein TadB
MTALEILPYVAIPLGLLASAAIVWALLRAPRANYRALMGARPQGGFGFSGAAQPTADSPEDDQLAKMKESKKGRRSRKPEPTFEEKMFRAGFFSERQRADLKRMQRLLPIVAGCVLAGVGAIAGSMQFALLGGVAGLLVGVYWPIKVVDRRIRERSEDILFYLPLVIEQVSIGVSSSLDIGPCLARVVQMADERDSHNPVTELVRYAQYHVKSGVSLEEALVEVGRLSGSVELKHAFMALAQVAKFGGEVSRQLQELADAVATQRETKIEAQIKKLELKATAPVSLVFLGYILNLLCGFMLQVIVNL